MARIQPYVATASAQIPPYLRTLAPRHSTERVAPGGMATQPGAWQFTPTANRSTPEGERQSNNLATPAHTPIFLSCPLS